MPERDVQELYRRYGAVIYSRCHRILRNNAAAEDAAQETFLRVHRHLSSVPQAEEAVRWIYRIATNHCLNELRRERMRGRTVDAVPEVADQPFGEDWSPWLPRISGKPRGSTTSTTSIRPKLPRCSASRGAPWSPT